MEDHKFKKLHLNLPVDPVINTKPWWVAGWLLLAVIMLLITSAYISNKEKIKKAQPREEIENTGSINLLPKILGGSNIKAPLIDASKASKPVKGSPKAVLSNPIDHYRSSRLINVNSTL